MKFDHMYYYLWYDDINGAPEPDFLSADFTKIETKYPVGVHRVTEWEIMRPDLISLTEYDTPDLWQLILFYNSIDDPSELEAGQQLQIPDIRDIYDFYRELRRVQI